MSVGDGALRLGIVGCGRMGSWHARAARLVAGTRLVAAADVGAGARQRFAAENPGVELYEACDEMLARARLDWVVVATQAPDHAAPTIAAARHGIHVHCEKPLSLSLADADRMVAACREAGVRLSVNHQRRRLAYNDLARQIMGDQGAFGDLVLVRVHFDSGRTAGYELIEVGTHYFDWARIFVGDVAWCFAAFTSDGCESTVADIHRSSDEGRPDQREVGPILGDRGVIQFGARTGVPVVAELVQKPHLPDKSLASGIDLIGTQGHILLRNGSPPSLWHFRGSYMYPHHGQSYQRRVLPREDFDENGWPRDGQADLLRSLARMHEDVVAAIREGRPVCSTGEDGRAALEMVLAAWESHRRKVRVELPLAEREHPLARWRADAPAGVG